MFLTERAQKGRKDRPGELPARILAESIVRTFGRKTYGSILQESAACICSCRKCSQDDTQILYQGPTATEACDSFVRERQGLNVFP